MLSTLFLLSLTASSVLSVSSGPFYVKGLQLFDDTLKSYDKRIRPYVDYPENIQASISIIRLYDYNPDGKTIKMTFNYREQWTDSRLAFDSSNKTVDHVHLPQEFWDRIWRPDTYFVSSSDNVILHDLPNTNGYLEISNEGLVKTSRKYSTDIPCKEYAKFIKSNEFKELPINCTLKIESYSFPAQDITYSWGDAVQVYPDAVAAIKSEKRLKYVKYQANDSLTETLNSRLTLNIILDEE